MEETAADANVGDYYISRFERCGFDEVNFVCIVGVAASYHVETWISSILEDDRLALHIEAYSEL